MAIPVLCTYSRMLLQEHFDADQDLGLKIGDRIVLRTRRGMELGRVAADPGSTKLKRNESAGGRVLRKATSEDIQKDTAEKVRVRVPESLRRARKYARDLKLDMQFIDIEETLDGERTIFYFTSPDRVDFRDLVKQLATELNIKVELRQVGARDVARLVGDVGSCGEELCCKTFLIDFVPVSMKMAKNQNLSLETAKISGMCGRLKCCLKYEDDLYTHLRKTMPQYGQPVTIREGQVPGFISGVSILEQRVTVRTASERLDLMVDEIEYDPTMTEREIRAWQRDRRERDQAEWEKKQQERQDRAERRNNRGAPPAPKAHAPSETSSETVISDAEAVSPQAEESDSTQNTNADRGESKERRGGQRRSQGPSDSRDRASRKPKPRAGEDAPSAGESSQETGAEGESGEGGEEHRRRRRSRSRRSRSDRTGSGGEGAQQADSSAGDSDAGQQGSENPRGEGGANRNRRRGRRGRGGRGRRPGEGGGDSGGGQSSGPAPAGE